MVRGKLGYKFSSTACIKSLNCCSILVLTWLFTLIRTTFDIAAMQRVIGFSLVFVIGFIVSRMPKIAAQDPKIGDVRLDGSSCSGNLEIYLDEYPYGERWYQICDRNMGDEEAAVVCRQIGCSTGNAQRKQASFGYYSFVFYIAHAYQCSGSESSLSSCNEVTAQCFQTSIEHGYVNDHVSIQCETTSGSTPTPSSLPTVAADPVVGDVRLSDGCSGELQVYDSLDNNKGWYSVCGGTFSEADSMVTCRNIGCPVNGATAEFRTSQSSLPSLLASFYCDGDEELLSKCSASLSECVFTTSAVHVQCGDASSAAGFMKISIVSLLLLAAVSHFIIM